MKLPVLHQRFGQPDRYRPARYTLLPFRFTRLDDSRTVVTSVAGDLLVVPSPQVRELIEGRIGVEDPLLAELAAKHIVMTDVSASALDLLAVKLRTRYEPLSNFTALHIFVVTLRCDHSCPYCQVSRVSSDRAAFDMTPETADAAVRLMFRSPSGYLKVEFQGGESLLNFDLIRRIILNVEEINTTERREVEFVVASNLAPLTDDMLAFMRDHRVGVSTSLDGPEDLHNANRPRPGNNSYALAVAGIARCREVLGPDSVSALMTTTSRSVSVPERIVDEYVHQGFGSIFLRWLSPYGFAAKTGRALGYSVADWNRFYEAGLRHILNLNKSGVRLREDYAAIVLRRMLTPYATGYVDLQSPTGLGAAVAVYNYDGDVYASDESRMLAETGDRTFRLGNVHANTYEEIFLSERLADLISRTMTEGIPGCSDCAFQPFCGTDPVFHHATQGDSVGHRPTSAFCARNMHVFRVLTRILEDEPEHRPVLEEWAC